MAGGLKRADMDPDPYREFEKRFTLAIDSGIPEPNAMSVATVDEHGQPWVRTVLLKTYDERGFVFFTNYESRKAADIEANPNVSLLFFWSEAARQVKIRGKAEKLSAAESMKYFLSRPRGSQLGAWVSPQSSVITSRSLLKNKFEELRQKFENKEIPLPSFWGGYRIVPDQVEFWQGRTNRLHDRFEYTKQDDGSWAIERLAP